MEAASDNSRQNTCILKKTDVGGTADSSDDEEISRRPKPSGVGAHVSHVLIEQGKINPDICCSGTLDMLAWVTPVQDTKISDDDATANEDIAETDVWGFL